MGSLGSDDIFSRMNDSAAAASIKGLRENEPEDIEKTDRRGRVTITTVPRKRGTALKEITLRKPTIGEAPAIAELVNRFAKQGLMLPRALVDVCERIRDFTICESNGRVIGCVAFHILWKDLGEIRSLAVTEHARRQRVGSRLVEYCLQEAQTLGITRVLTLTYECKFFGKLRFRKCSKETLPQKVWKDCINCPHFPNCNETAMLLHLKPTYTQRTKRRRL